MDKPEILIIDDEESLHEILIPYLQVIGIKAVSAMNGKAGLELLSDHASIHTVITDIRIPGVDGFDVLREIKSRRGNIRVIVMTGYSDKAIAIQALKLGADDFLEKPFRLEELGAIIESKRDHDKLTAVSQKWQQAKADIRVGTIWCSTSGEVQRVSAEAAALTGLSADDCIQKNIADIPELAALKNCFGRTSASTQIIEMKRTSHWLHICAENVDSRDETTRLLILTNVTDRFALEKEIAELTSAFETRVEQRTQSLSNELDFSEQLLDAVGVLVAYIDGEGRLARFNKFGEHITGLNKAAAEQLFAAIVRGNIAPLNTVFDPLAELEPSGLLSELPIANSRALLMSWTVRKMKEIAGARGKLIVGVDVTEQKKLEAQLQSYNDSLQSMVESRSKELRLKDAQLIHSARLATLGEIAAGIAHEMKQPLNVISITADLIKLLHRNGNLNDDLLISNLEKIRGTVDRMASTINHLRGFTRIDTANFRLLKISEVFDGALSIVGEQIRLDDIDIEQKIDDSLPPIAAELHQIEQVLVNLLQNARDAIEDRSRAKLDSNPFPRIITLSARASSDQSEIYLEVNDTGLGLTDEVRERLFEPFFTTKDSERGTGLGLSISMNIVQSHGGMIEAESTPGIGTTFRIVLPAALPTDS